MKLTGVCLHMLVLTAATTAACDSLVAYYRRCDSGSWLRRSQPPTPNARKSGPRQKTTDNGQANFRITPVSAPAWNVNIIAGEEGATIKIGSNTIVTVPLREGTPSVTR